MSNGPVKQYLNCLKYDIRQGIVRRFGIYALFALFMAAAAADAALELREYVGAPSVTDILTKLFFGLPKDWHQVSDKFEVPFLYLTIYFLASLLGCSYLRRDMREQGSMRIVRCRMRWVWWLSKCTWGILSSAVVFLLVFVSVWLTAGIMGNWGTALGSGIDEALRLPFIDKSPARVFFFVLLTGFITMAAINQLQLLIQLLMSPAIALTVVLTVLIVSAYAFSPFLIGNNLMLCRSSLFIEDGINGVTAAVSAVPLWTAGLLAGGVIIERKNIF